MKRTALYDKHVALDARIVPFAGYEMPVQYTGMNDEHRTVREAVGMFDTVGPGSYICQLDGLRRRHVGLNFVRL